MPATGTTCCCARGGGMSAFEMTIQSVSEPPTKPGYYLAWDWTPKPAVLHWSADYGWRDCGVKRPVSYYAGPLPERKGK